MHNEIRYTPGDKNSARLMFQAVFVANSAMTDFINKLIFL